MSISAIQIVAEFLFLTVYLCNCNGVFIIGCLFMQLRRGKNISLFIYNNLRQFHLKI